MDQKSSRPAPRLLIGAAFSALLLAACQQVYFRALNAGVAGTPTDTVLFNPALRLSLDVYRPVGNSALAPVIVFFYGGSWRDGQRDFYRFVGEALARRGVLVVIPDYRKAPEHVFPTFMEDAAEATAWARAHAAQYGGDPSRLYVMGHSAGGHIAALLGTDARYLQARGMKPRDLAGVIGLAGAYDFLPLVERNIQQVFGTQAEWPASQPVNFVDGDEPPFLLLHGASDMRVRPFNSESLAAKLRAAGEPVTLHIVPEIGHVALVNGFRSPRFSPVLEETLAWLKPATP